MKNISTIIDSITSNFFEQRDRWFLWLPVFIAIGIGMYFSLNFEPKAWIGTSVTIVLLLRIWSEKIRERSYFIWLPLLMVALGFSAAQLRTYIKKDYMLERKTYAIELVAKVEHVEAMPKGEDRVILKNITYAKSTQKNMPSTIRIKLKKGKHYTPHAGEVIKLKAILLPISAPVLPNAFDFQRFAYFKGFYATGYAISDATVIEPVDEGYMFPSLRRYLRDNIKENIKDSDVAAITIALLDGEDRDISNETNDIVRRAGIAHLMAISGLQVALVTGFFFVLLRAGMASIPNMALKYPIKKIAAFIAMLGAIFYMGLIGDAVSAERSVIMMCVVMIAIILDRDPFTLRLAAFASGVMLLYEPEILFGASFQLSFSAVVALIAFYEATSDWWSKLYIERSWKIWVLRNFSAMMLTTLVATVAVAPFSLFHFLRASLFPGLVANIVAVPLSSFVTIPAAIIGSLLMPLGLEYWPLQVSRISVELIIKVAREVASWPYGMFYLNAWSIWLLVAITFGGLWICIWRGRVRWLGLLPIIIAASIIPFAPRADILIASSGNLFAVSDDSGKLWFSESKREKFVKQKWLEVEGNGEVAFWKDKSSPVKCDDIACIYNYKNKLISFIKDYSAVNEDCENADIVISNLKISRKQCPKPKVLIDAMDIRYKGAHTIYINDNGIKVKTVLGARGKRTWAL